MANACFEHSNFFTVKDEHPLPNNLMPDNFCPNMARDDTNSSTEYRTDRSHQRSNYELLTATTLIYAIGAGITAAAGTRLAPN